MALVTRGHWPISGTPTWEQVENLPSTVVTDTTLFGLLTLAAWVVWAAFCASVVVEIVGTVRGEPGTQLPLCGQVQRWARPLVASMVMSVSASGSLASATAGAPALVKPVAAVASAEPPGPVIGEVPGPRAPGATAASAQPVSDVTAGRTVEVVAGDTYWGLAERELGDGLRWREIQDLNVAAGLLITHGESGTTTYPSPSDP